MDEFKWYIIFMIILIIVGAFAQYLDKEQEIRKLEIQAKIEAKEK